MATGLAGDAFGVFGSEDKAYGRAGPMRGLRATPPPLRAARRRGTTGKQQVSQRDTALGQLRSAQVIETSSETHCGITLGWFFEVSIACARAYMRARTGAYRKNYPNKDYLSRVISRHPASSDQRDPLKLPLAGQAATWPLENAQLPALAGPSLAGVARGDVPPRGRASRTISKTRLTRLTRLTRRLTRLTRLTLRCRG